MSLDRNIGNAVKVLHQTYYGIEKLAKYLQMKCEEYGYVCVTPSLLMWQSKSNPWGWLTCKFTLLFQHGDRPQFENGWYEDDIFGMEISFEEDEAALYITRLRYDGEKEGLPSSQDWYFTHPKWDSHSFKIRRTEGGLILSEPQDEKVKIKFKGLKQAIYKRDTFSDISSENVKEKVFDVMDELARLPDFLEK